MTEQLSESEIAAALKRREETTEWNARNGLRENNDGTFTAVVSTPRSDPSGVAYLLGGRDLRAQDDIVRRLERIEKELKLS